MIDRIVFVLLVFVCCNMSVRAQQNGGGSMALNGTWAFKTDPNNRGEQQQWFSNKTSTQGWDSMSVPGNWDTRNEYAHYAGKGWYRKTIAVPQQWKGKAVFLTFEGVYHDSKVWVNGQLAATNNSGFLPFEIEVSKWLTAGKNTITVCADNTSRLGAVWNWGGIRRPVTMKVSPDVRIVRQHITPTVNLQTKTATIAIKLFLQNTTNQPKTVSGTVLLNKENLYKRSLAFNATLAANSSKTVMVNTEVNPNELHLWHFDDPFLYNCTSSITNGNGPPSRVHNRFGLRKIEVDNLNYTFKLNGEPVRLMGFNLVPEDRTTGNTLPLWRIKEDVDLMKSVGGNLTRISHLPLPAEMYDYLDERGMLVFPEVSLWGADARVNPADPLPKEWLSRLIENYYNHPSIIGWSVGNEIGHNQHVMEYVKGAIENAKSLDSTRLAVMVSHTADRRPDPIQYSELGLVNKYGKNLGPVTDKMHQLHPNKLLFYTEYGIGQMSEDLDANFDAKSLIDSIRFKPYVMGASLWTFNDYRSSYYRTKEFSENRPWGVVDVFRQKKKAWYSIRKEHAPIASLTIENTTVVKGAQSSATIILTPRAALDLPAYTMNNYRLVWTVKDQSGEVRQAGFNSLPVIRPGDQTLQQRVSWIQPADALSLQIELVSPLNYSLYDTVIYFTKPAVPVIKYAAGMRTQLNDWAAKTGAIRVVFDKHLSATGYKVKYGKNGLTEDTPVTLNHYINIGGLDFGETYQLQLVAVNSAGESEPTPVQKVLVGYSPAPPIIRYTEPADNGFFVGYATDEDDYAFRVQYTTKAGDYASARTIQTTAKGVLFVPDLKNGQRYFYRMMRLKQNAYQSTWSEEIAVMPDGNQRAAVPEIGAVIQNGTTALVLFEPVKKATGYLLQYKPQSSANWQSIRVEAAQVNQYLVEGLTSGTAYDFKMAVINAYGQSGFSAVRRAGE